MNVQRRFVPGHRLLCVAVGRSQSVPPGLFVLRQDACRAAPSSASAVGDADGWGAFSDESLLCLFGPRDESHNKTLDPTAVSGSDLLRCGFLEFLSSFGRAVPAVGQLGRYAKRA